MQVKSSKSVEYIRGHSKGLTPYERSKARTRLAEAARALAQRQIPGPRGSSTTGLFRTNSARKSRGRPATPGSYRDVARRTGIPVSTIRDAERHVGAVARYAELQAPDIPQADAIALAKTLDALPEEARVEKRQALRERRPGILAELGGTPPRRSGPGAEETTHAWERADPMLGWPHLVQQLDVLLSGVEAGGGLAAVTRAWDPDHREVFLEDIDRMIARLARLRTTLRRLIDA